MLRQNTDVRKVLKTVDILANLLYECCFNCGTQMRADENNKSKSTLRKVGFLLLSFPNVSGSYFLCQFKPTASQHQFTPLIQTWLSICAMCLISKAEDQISGTLVIASQLLLLNCLLMFTDVCPQVVLFSPFTDSSKKYFRHPAITMEPGRRRHSCVPAANRSYRRSSTRSDASLYLMIMICLRLMNFLVMLPIWRIVL